jgi:hypothetical protein
MRNMLGGPMCKFCKHYQVDALGTEVCKAYPKGIPDRILIEDELMKVPAAHWQPYGDEEAPVVFEKRDDVEWDEVTDWDDRRIEMRGIVGPASSIIGGEDQEDGEGGIAVL